VVGVVWLSVLMRTFCSALFVLAFSVIVVAGWLWCSGDTDECDPSWINGALMAYGVVGGLFMLWRAFTFTNGGRFAIELVLAYSVLFVVEALA
jgi:hypothetical protein